MARMKARDRRNLGLVILFVSPCAISSLFLAEEFGWCQILLVACIVGWMFSAAYNLIRNRSFVKDVSPFLLLPVALGLLVWRLGRKVVSLFGWGLRVVDFVRGKRQAECDVRLGVPRDWNTLLSNERMMNKLASGRKVVLGYNDRRVVMSDLTDDRHLLITGVTGQGKTTVIYSAILSLLSIGLGVFDRTHFSIHDPKRVVGTQFRALEDVYPDYFSVHMHIDDSFKAMQKLVEEMTDRTELLGQQRVFEVNQLDPPLPHKLIVLDEPQLWYGENRRYESLIFRLVTAGRQAGFHMVLLTPYAHSEVVKTTYRPNFRLISSRLPSHARGVVGMDGVTNLGQYEFLYQENEIDPPVFFRTYHITPEHISWAVANVMFSAKSPEEIAIYLFMSNGDRGIRTVLREGVHFCQALVEAGRLDQVPFPWSEVTIDNGNFNPTGNAWEWGKEFMRQLEYARIAGEAEHGRSRDILARDLTDALRLWKIYIGENK